MNRQQLLTHIENIIEVPFGSLHEHDVLLHLGSWTSIAYLSVIAFYDEQFQLIPDGEKLEQVITVADLLNLVAQRLD